MRKMKNYLALLCIGLCLNACKKKKVEPVPDQEIEIPGAVKTKHGETVGTANTLVIGAAGGTLSIPNSQLKLIVPPGAVDKDTKFSVQEVKSTLPSNAVSSATYRFLPEDVQFQKEVQIVMPFNYENYYATKTIRPIYQDKHGYWHVVKNATMDMSQQTITVKTKHFSDWSSIPLYYIEITGKKRLEKGESTTLTVNHWPTTPSGEDNDDLLAPTGEVGASFVKEWRLYGTGGTEDRGTVTGSGGSGIFTAPANYPPYQRVTGIEAVMNIGGFLGDQSLIIYVDRLAESYCYASINGDPPTNTFGTNGIAITSGNPMQVTFYSHNGTRISFQAPTNTFGKYVFGPETQVTFSYNLGNYYSSTYTECLPAGDLFTKGDIVVIENKNGLVKGDIQGFMRTREKQPNGTYCWGKEVLIEAEFRYKVR